MNGRVDMVIWTKNGESTLPFVLKRIREVMPAESVGQKILVDDSSIDCTREIAENFGWRVILSIKKGISHCANTALQHIETEFFVSFEQDLLLNRNWWRKIKGYLSEPKVVIASGLRFAYYPLALRKIEEYQAEVFRIQEKEGFFVPYLKTLDNTIYNTQIIKEIGGFPIEASSLAVDQVLAQRLHLKGYRWKVDYDLHSIHLQGRLKDEFAHNYLKGIYSEEIDKLLYQKSQSNRSLLARLLISPAIGFKIAMKTKTPFAFCLHPMLRWHYVKGVVEGRKQKR